MTLQAPLQGYRIEPLTPRHDRAVFHCGIPALDNYLQRQARQDAERNLAAVFVLTSDSKTIAGFYTLSASSIQATDLPDAIARGLPKFPLPATLIGRMAIAASLQSRGLGEIILMQSLDRALITSKHVASWAVIVDAKEGARDFYLKHEFLPLISRQDRLFLPMKTIEKLMEKSR